MKKIITLLLTFAITVVFSACNNLQENTSDTISTSSILADTYSALNSVEETVSSDASSEEATLTSSASETSTVQTTNSSNTAASSTLASSGCTHPDYWEGSTGLHWIGGWHDRAPGIENKFTLLAACEEPREVVYKCPICLEPVLVETLEPSGHDFSGEEEVLSYPTINSEGSWGIKCVGYHNMCKEIKLTTTIPKRGGSYETIDSCFTISGNDYEMDNPYMIIMDRRTWGDVPTIVFDTESCIGTISYIQQDGTLYEAAIVVDKALLSEGWRYKGTISDSGEYSVQYGRWGAWDGESSNNN